MAGQSDTDVLQNAEDPTNDIGEASIRPPSVNAAASSAFGGTELVFAENGDDFETDSTAGGCAGGFSEFETPELEYDELGLELAAQEGLEIDPDCQGDSSDAFRVGQMTPDGLIEEDFEQELGCVARETNVQEVIDREFHEISNLGIIQVAGDDRQGRRLIIVSACRLPDSSLINHQRLLAYIKKTLEQYVANDYSLVYLHYGFSSRNKPKFSWMLQAYREFDRNFKKNLKALYVVHPTTFAKILWNLFRPVISSKMSRKVMYVDYLYQLEHFLHLDQLPVPQRVRDHDRELVERVRSRGTPSDDPAHSSSFYSPLPTQQFGVSLQHIKHHGGGRTIPAVMEDTISYLRECALDVEGLFRRSASVEEMKRVQSRYNAGESVDFKDLGNPHLAAMILKAFLRELSEPLITFELYEEVLKTHGIPAKDRVHAIKEIVVNQLPDDNYYVLNHLIHFLTEVASHSGQNKMTAANLAIVFAPNLIWSRQQPSLTVAGIVNAFTHQLIDHYDYVFIK